MGEKDRCPKCGAELSPGVSPGGLCPKCLMKQAMGSEIAPEREPEHEPEGGSGTLPIGETGPLEVSSLVEAFPQLEIMEILGQGGMGVVYKARQKELDRLVALKILPLEAEKDPAFAQRFTREARALARLSHPGIVTIHDFGKAGAHFYFIMEYVDGTDLRRLMRGGEMTAREALKIIPQICEALQYAHDEGIVHRDIKPENVLLDKKGRVKIADFGLARILGHKAEDFRLTGTRQVMGTPHYMAPEQIEKPQEVDHRADIYSLGVVFYEMLTGELPLGRFEPPSKKVQVDVRLDEIVLRSLEKEPDRRYQHISEVKTDVEAIDSGADDVKPDAVQQTGQDPRLDEVKRLRLAGQTIRAIKLYRQIYDVDLREAKKTVDLMVLGPEPDPEEPIAPSKVPLLMGNALAAVISSAFLIAGPGLIIYGFMSEPIRSFDFWYWLVMGLGTTLAGVGAVLGAPHMHREILRRAEHFPEPLPPRAPTQRSLIGMALMTIVLAVLVIAGLLYLVVAFGTARPGSPQFWEHIGSGLPMILLALIIAAQLWTDYRKMEGRVDPINEPLWTSYDTGLVAAVVFGALTFVLSPWLRDTSMFFLLFPGAMFILIASCALLVLRFMNRRALALRAQSPSGEPRLGKTSGPRDR